MNRRHYLLTLGAVSAIAGCNENSSGVPDESDNGDANDSEPEPEAEPEENTTGSEENAADVEAISYPGEILENEIASVAGIDGPAKIGDELQIDVIVTLPVTDGLYDARVDTTLLNGDGDVVGSETVDVGDVADDETAASQTIETPIWIPTSELTEATYTVRVEVEDYPSGETVVAEQDGIEILYPDSEERAAVEEYIESIRKRLQDGVGELKARGGGSITGVSAEDTDISMGEIIDIVLPVDGELRSVQEYEVAETVYADELEHLELQFVIIRRIVQRQRNFFDIVQRAYEVFDRFEREDTDSHAYDRFGDDINSLSSALYSGGDNLESLVNDAVRMGKTIGRFEAKFEQFDAEFADIERIEAAAETTNKATKYLLEAREKLNSGQYNQTQLDADEAEFLYRNASGELDGVEELTSTAADFQEITDELELRARDLRREAAAEADSN